MNQITQIEEDKTVGAFLNKNAEFASANQDAIRKAMFEATPPDKRNNGWANEGAKGANGLRRGSIPDSIYRKMQAGETYTVRQLSEAANMSGKVVSNAIRDLRRHGLVHVVPKHEGILHGYRRVS